MKHLLNIDDQLWTEWQLEELDGMVSDPVYFFERASEIMKPIRYSQIEFKDMPKTLCTLYGNLNALASRTGREFSVAERRELCNLRIACPDYKKEVWWLTSVWCDVVRRYWNTHNPENPIVTFAIDIRTDLWRKFFSKNFPIATSVRGNKAYSDDGKDGILHETSWWKSTWWHCRARIGMKFHDNYWTSKSWREYEYPSVDNYMDSVDNGYERPVFFAYFLEKELSGDGAKLVKYMKAKVWNGENANKNITRYEASVIASRLNPKAKDIWNWKDWDKEASKYEVSVMLNRAIELPIYTWTDRNQSISRKEVILWLP